MVAAEQQFMTPSEIRSVILRPAGVSSVVAILSATPESPHTEEVRIVFCCWEDAYRVLQHCKRTQRTLQVRARPGARGPVAWTKTQVARHAAAEGTESRSPPESPRFAHHAEPFNSWDPC